MSLLSELIVRITAQTTDFQRNLVGAQKSISSVGKSMADMGRTMSIAVSAPLLGVGLAALKVAGDMESAKIGFTTLLGSGQKATAMLKDLRTFALQTPFNFPDLVTASQRMMAMGFAAKEVIPSLTAIGNATSALGRGPETLDRIVLALGQMRNSAKVSAQDMNQLTQAGIDGWGFLAKASGLSIKEIRAQAKDLFTGAEAAEIIMKGMATTFSGAMEEQAKGLKGLWSNAQDAVTFALADIGNVLLPFGKDFLKNNLQPMLDGLTTLAHAFNDLPGWAQKATIGVGVLAAALPLAVYGIGTLIESTSTVIRGLNNLAKAWDVTSLGLAARFGLWALAAAEVATLIYSLAQLHEAEDAVAKAGDDQARSIQKLENHLNKLGITIGTASVYYHTGQMSAEMYMKTLIALATEHGKTVPVVLSAADAAKKHAAAMEEAAKRTKVAKEAMHEFGEEFRTALTPHVLTAKELAQATLDIGHSATEAALNIGKGASALENMRAIAEATKAGLKDMVPSKLGDQLDIVCQKAQSTADAIDKTGVAVSKTTATVKQSESVWTKLGNQVSLVVNDLARDITDLIFKGGKLKDVVVGTFENIGKAIVRSAIEKQLKSLAAQVMDLISKSGALGKILGAVFGGGAAPQGKSVPGIPGVPGTTTAPVGGVAGAASSGIMGTIGAVGAAVGAVSSIIGNFQMAGMNKSLDLIEKATRYSEAYLLNLNSIELTWLPKLDHLVDIWGAIMDLDHNLSGAGAGGGNITFNFYGGSFTTQAETNRMMETAVRQLKLAKGMKA